MIRHIVTCLAAALLLSSVAFTERSTPANAMEAGPRASEQQQEQWVAAHRRTGLWAKAHNGDKGDQLFRMVDPGTTFRLALPPNGPRVYVWDPTTRNYAWIDADDIGPVGGRRIRVSSQSDRDEEKRGKPQDDRKEDKREDKAAEPARDDPPADNRIWAGTARVTMYTCVELGGCNRTASGVWPYEGVVAVDPRLIPLGSTVWIEGLGTFLAADTGSAIRGAAIDVYVTDYPRAIRWGIQYRPVVAYVTGR